MKKITRNLRVVETEVLFYFENEVHNKTFLFPAPVSQKEIEGLLELIFPCSKLLKITPYGVENFTIGIPLTLLLNLKFEYLIDSLRKRMQRDISDDNTGD